MGMFIVRTRETRETTRKQPANTVKPLNRTRRTPTRKTWGRGLTGTGTGWPGIPQGYPWYSLDVVYAPSRSEGQAEGLYVLYLITECFINDGFM